MQIELKSRIQNANTEKPEKGPYHSELSKFVGRWKVAGQIISLNTGEPPEFFSGDETFEWMDGEYFLLNRFNRAIQGRPFSGLGWIGFDNAAATYLSYSISNLGYLRIYEVEVEPDELRYRGESERGRLHLSEDASVMTVHWEQRSETGEWKPLCDLIGHRMTS